MKSETPEEKGARVRKFLMECSGQELADFLLARYADAANARKQMRQILDEWIERTAEARLAAEVAIIREEFKHKLTLPFPKKVEQAPPHGETPTRPPVLQHRNHRWGNADAQSGKQPRQFVKS